HAALGVAVDAYHVWWDPNLAAAIGRAALPKAITSSGASPSAVRCGAATVVNAARAAAACGAALPR
nr:hypothetical protein [Polyangiaceae bacterium]